MHALRAVGLLAFTTAMLAAPAIAPAQGTQEWDPQRVVATRAGLQELKSRLLQAARSPAYSPHLRTFAAQEAGLIDRRLVDGDFRPGDRLFVQVEGETALTDTFSVGPARDITLQMVGAVPLVGVLRADIEPYLTNYLGRYLRNPRVHAHPLISITVTGHVTHPGFYTVMTGIPLSRVLTDAMGPTADANLGSITLLRGGNVVLGGTDLQVALNQGRTLEQLGVRAGDQLQVGGGETDFYRVFQTMEFGLGIPLALFSLVRLVKP